MQTQEKDIDEFVAAIANEHPDRDQIIFICIGSDRSTGDSFGPLVGSMLKKRGWKHIIGTLEQPCDAYAVEAASKEVIRGIAGIDNEDANKIVVAIDACLGKPNSVGSFITAYGSLQPGKAIGRRLPPIGQYSIAGVVNMYGPKAYWMLQTTSLYHVMQMAERAADAIDRAWTEANCVKI